MDLKLCDSDYRFMMVVWEHEPVKSTKLAKLCAEELGWKKSTTFTAIKKLSQKGFLENVDATVSSLAVSYTHLYIKDTVDLANALLIEIISCGSF